MPVGLGYEGWFGFGQESTWGTKVTRTKFLEFVAGGDGLGITEEPVLSESVRLRGYHKTTDFAQGLIRAGGPMTFEVPIEGAELLMYHAFGNKATTQPDITNAPTVYQHVLTLADDLMAGKGLSLEVDRSVANFSYFGGKVANVEFRCEVGAYLRAAMEFICKDGAEETSPSTPSFPAARPFVFTEGYMSWNVAEVEVASGVLTLNNNLDRDRTKVGSRFIREPRPAAGKREVPFSFTCEFDSLTQFNDFRAATVRALMLRFQGDVIAAGFNYKYQFDAPDCRILACAPVINNEGRIIYEITGRAWKGDASEELQLTIVNTVASI